jgi:four helix bundle protein
MQRFTELRIWQCSHQLAMDVYRLTALFPQHEQYGVVAQVRKSVISIPRNIAKGAKRQSQLEYARFLNIGEGSLAETESLRQLSRDLELTSGDALDRLVQEGEQPSRMVHGMRKAVLANITRGRETVNTLSTLTVDC